jgi:hypothetical protein
MNDLVSSISERIVRAVCLTVFASRIRLDSSTSIVCTDRLYLYCMHSDLRTGTEYILTYCTGRYG